MPHTYMRTSFARSGLNSAFSPVSELWILSIRLEPAARGGERHEFQERGELRAVRLPGKRDAQRHVQFGAAASGALLQDLGEQMQIGAGGVQGGRGGGEELR